MDATDQLIDLLEALNTADREKSVDRLMELADLIDRGGDIPDVYAALREFKALYPPESKPEPEPEHE